MHEERHIGGSLAPRQVNHIRAERVGLQDEVAEERRSEADRVTDLLIVARVRSPQHVQERGEITAVVSQRAVVIDCATQLDRRCRRRVVEVVDASVMSGDSTRELVPGWGLAVWTCAGEGSFPGRVHLLCHDRRGRPAPQRSDAPYRNAGVRPRPHGPWPPARACACDRNGGLRWRHPPCPRRAEAASSAMAFNIRRNESRFDFPVAVRPDEHVERAELQIDVADGLEPRQPEPAQVVHLKPSRVSCVPCGGRTKEGSSIEPAVAANQP